LGLKNSILLKKSVSSGVSGLQEGWVCKEQKGQNNIKEQLFTKGKKALPNST
jgi:hypothetical protein